MSKRLVHADHEGELLGLAGGEQALLEPPRDGIMLHRDQGTHLERGAYLGPVAPDHARLPPGAAVGRQG